MRTRFLPVSNPSGSATRTPDVKAVLQSYRLYGAVHTISPTSPRHRQFVKHDALDLGDEGSQHHAVERRRCRAITPTRDLKHVLIVIVIDRHKYIHIRLRRTRVMSVRKMTAKIRCSGRSAAFSAQRPMHITAALYALERQQY